MDFHSLSRKELQTLCKKNKIPANITNVAMADALKALEIVEGLEEFMDQTQSPEKSMNKSLQEIPSTVTRTSTRRKTIKEGPQCTQTTTRTRRTTRRTMELSEENANVNVPENLVMATTTRRNAPKPEPEPEVKEQQYVDLHETPALQSGRRRPGVVSRRKVEAQTEEGSLQQGNGTRRSVRLLGKCMTGLSLKESEKMEPVKIDKCAEGNVENMNAQNGATSEVPLARNLSASLDDESDLKDDVLEDSKCHNGENDCTVISEADLKDATPDEKIDEPKSEDKAADIPYEIIGQRESDDAAVFEDLCEIVSLNKKMVADETMSIEPSVAAFESSGISEQVLDHSSSAEIVEPIEVASVQEYAYNDSKDVECQKLFGKDCDVSEGEDDLAPKLPEAEENDEGKATLPNNHMDSSEKKGNEKSNNGPDEIVLGSKVADALLADSDIDDGTVCENNSLADEESEDDCPDEIVTRPNTDLGINDVTGSNNNSSADEESDDDDTNSDINDDTRSDCSSVDHMIDEGGLIDVNVAESEIIHESSLHNGSQSVLDDIPAGKMTDCGNAEGLVEVRVEPTMEFAETAQEILPVGKSPIAAKLKSPCASPTPNNEITNSIPLSPLTAQLSQPTRFTPRKSSSKKQTTIPKVIEFSHINKENIQNVSVKKELEPGLEKMKKNKKILDEETMQNLENRSLRDLKKLTKMLENLKITNHTKNKEDKNVTKQPFGKSRTALQTLPQNCMTTAEAEKQS